MLAFFPDQTAPFSLPLYDSAPEDQRPRFHARFISARKRVELTELERQCYELFDAGKHGEALDRIDQIIAGLVARVENAPPGFDLQKATATFDVPACWAIVGGAYKATEFTRDDQKKSESPSKSDTGSSASTAAPAPAAAK